MALQTVPNKMGWNINFHGNWLGLFGTTSVLNASGRSVTFIGKVFLEAGSGTKTISSAGGKILWRRSSVTFSNAATRLRVGVQDVNTGTGIEDGTFDVYHEYSTTPGANTCDAIAMSSGTKTINHGDLIAISIEMTVRGGTDSVTVVPHLIAAQATANSNFPYKTEDSGAGPVISNVATCGATIEFDDGTLGWLEPGFLYPNVNVGSTLTYNTGSSPDEYGMFFRLPFKCSIRQAWLSIGSIASTDNFDMILYSDPFGTPVAEITNSINPALRGNTSNNSPYHSNFSSFTLNANSWYGIVARPTTANSISLEYKAMGSGGAKYKRIMPFGADFILAGRSNQTGVFTETDTNDLPVGGIYFDAFDDGVQTGGADPVETYF